MRSLKDMSKTGLLLSQRMTAAVVLALFCWLNVLAVTPALHAKAHCTAEHADEGHQAPTQSPNHHCVITLLAQGQLELIVPPTVPTAPTTFEFIAEPVTAPAFSSHDVRLLPGRAPPVLPA
jgi:hypothetical protein